MATLKWACLWGVCVLVSATSQGVATTTCDPWANMGCSQWHQGNRLNCTDPNKGPMAWASRPIRTTDFSVRSSDGLLGLDPTTYLPGAMMTIYVRALQYARPFRGLLLTAYSQGSTIVGSWVYPADDQALFWSPPQCNQSAMHNSATVKPYLSLIRFMAPPAGTGAITIRALVKCGVANTGDFFLPQTDLVLQEQFSEPVWFAANTGEDCPSCCSRNGRSGFDASTQATFVSAESFRLAADKKVLCNLPVLSSCSAAAPVIDTNNYCYMREPNCSASWRLASPVPNSRNLCACAVMSSAPSMAISRWVLGLLGLISLSSQKRHFFLYIALACVLLPSVQAHNWIYTPGRASTQASTIFPCQARKATDLHAQLSRTQTFNTKWAVGHDREAYFVLIHEKDQDMLYNSSFETMVDDYLLKGSMPPYNAPNMANDLTFMRYHGTHIDPVSGGYFDTSKPPGSLFASEVLPGDVNYLTHPRSNETSRLFRYTDTARASDIRMQYASTEYPWIEMAFRAPHVFHLADDFNIFRTQLAGRAGDGHYILHWRWSGYFDCIDIDLRSAFVDNIYGLDSAAGSYVYNRIDHCQYIEPQQIVTPCVEVGWNILSCVERLPGWMENNRLGINVVPFKNPSAVYKGFKKEINIPWNNARCSETEWMDLPGNVTVSPIDFNSASVFKASKQSGVVCINTLPQCTGGNGGCSGDDTNYVDNFIQFRRALAMCVGHQQCVGLAIKNDPSFPANTVPTDNEGHEILLCTATGITPNLNYTVYFPTGLQTYADLSNPARSVGFVPQRFEASLPPPAANTFRDHGEPYNANTMMGWSCNTSVDCAWCCSNGDCNTNPPSGNTPTSYGSFLSVYDRCPNNPEVVQRWEVGVPDGVYDFTLYSNSGNGAGYAWVTGCNVEGALMQTVSMFEEPQPATLTRRVEVTDGRLTLDGEAGAEKGCSAVSWVSYQQIRTKWNEVWYPETPNPWWQKRFAEPEPVGVVDVQGLGYYYKLNGVKTPNCAAWWQWRGSRCASGRPIGWFNGTEDGAIVGVSNGTTPCSSTGCTGIVCGVVNRAGEEWEIDHNYVDCKGAVGQVVWVYLPGRARSFISNVAVRRAYPKVPAALENTTRVCYGVEARPSAATIPEYVITTDPEDPVFHSTCYMREKNITWLPTNPSMEVSTPVARWRFNQHCLDCATYHHNAQRLGTREIPAPWTLADGKCANCDLEGIPPPINKTQSNWKMGWKGQLLVTPAATCSDPRADYCRKSLFMYGRAEDYQLQVMDEIDCQILAERDPDCQPIVQYQRAWWQSWVPGFFPEGRVCNCWRKDACCGRPVVFEEVPLSEVGSEVYRAEEAGLTDPTCASGIKSPDNGLCCPSYCKDAAGNSVCGWNSGACYQTLVGGGSCCPNATVAPCTTAAAPCLL